MSLEKMRNALRVQLDEQRRIADDEAKERGYLLGNQLAAKDK